MEPGGGAGSRSPGVGRRRSSRIPILSSRLRNTDAEERLSQIFESEDGEAEELRTGAGVVIAQLEIVEEEEIDAVEAPELLVDEEGESGIEDEANEGGGEVGRQIVEEQVGEREGRQAAEVGNQVVVEGRQEPGPDGVEGARGAVQRRQVRVVPLSRCSS